MEYEKEYENDEDEVPVASILTTVFSIKTNKTPFVFLKAIFFIPPFSSLNIVIVGPVQKN